MKRDALPGGARIKKKKKKRAAKKKAKAPCKYGERGEDGLCPPKPKKARKAKAKKPCKYGPRDADGLCPKKPRKNPFAEEDEGPVSIVEKKIPVGVTKAGNVRTTTLRREAEKVLVRAAENAGKKAVDKAFDMAKDPEVRAKVSAALSGSSPAALAYVKKLPLVGLVAAAGYGIGSFAGKELAYRRVREKYVESWLRDALAGPGGKQLTPAMQKILRKQYADFFDMKNRSLN